jgi:hypothetical protein
MPVYQVTLSRAFAVTVECDDPETAREVSELYVGYSDDSVLADRQETKFTVLNVEMVMNEALEAERI